VLATVVQGDEAKEAGPLPHLGAVEHMEDARWLAGFGCGTWRPEAYSVGLGSEAWQGMTRLPRLVRPWGWAWHDVASRSGRARAWRSGGVAKRRGDDGERKGRHQRSSFEGEEIDRREGPNKWASIKSGLRSIWT
jgi:hypothetical protein